VCGKTLPHPFIKKQRARKTLRANNKPHINDPTCADLCIMEHSTSNSAVAAHASGEQHSPASSASHAPMNSADVGSAQLVRAYAVIISLADSHMDDAHAAELYRCMGIGRHTSATDESSGAMELHDALHLAKHYISTPLYHYVRSALMQRARTLRVQAEDARLEVVWKKAQADRHATQARAQAVRDATELATLVRKQAELDSMVQRLHYFVVSNSGEDGNITSQEYEDRSVAKEKEQQEQQQDSYTTDPTTTATPPPSDRTAAVSAVAAAAASAACAASVAASAAAAAASAASEVALVASSAKSSPSITRTGLKEAARRRSLNLAKATQTFHEKERS